MFKRLACCLLGSWLTLAGIAAAEIGPDDVLYFPMTDRYYRSGEPPPGVELQPSNPLGWHGGNLRGLSEKADYIHDLGVTVLWLAPFMQNTDEHHFGTFVGKGFHGYWIHDHERVEPHQGTEADLVNTVKTFKSKGMKVIADIVLNQVGPDHPWVKDPSKVDWFHHEGPIQNYDDEHQAEFGDLGGLPDLDQENPEVYRYLLKNTADWVTKLNLDGIRFDAVRHVGKAFWKRFIPDLRRATGKPDLFVLGEVFKGDPAYIAEYQKLGFDYLFDMPLRDTIVEVIGKGQTATLFSHRFAQDKIYPDAHKLVTLIDNHDMPRFITAALGDFDTRLQRLKQACAFLISVRGLPSFYYGTEVAMEGGPDPDNRKDMDFGRNRKMRRYFSHLMEIRSSSTALRQGSQRELLADRDVYAFARYSPQQEAVCIFNFSDQPQKRDLGVGLGQEFTDLLTDEVIDARGGHLRLKMAPHGALLLVRP